MDRAVQAAQTRASVRDVRAMTAAARRQLHAVIRSGTADENTLLPRMGITLAEACTAMNLLPKKTGST